MIKEKGEGHSCIFVCVFHFGSLYHIWRSFYFVVFGAFGEGMKDGKGGGGVWKNQKVISMCVCMGGTLRY
jgi:hypothetical protein